MEGGILKGTDVLGAAGAAGVLDCLGFFFSRLLRSWLLAIRVLPADWRSLLPAHYPRI
jgi:hypothetical protein